MSILHLNIYFSKKKKMLQNFVHLQIGRNECTYGKKSLLIILFYFLYFLTEKIKINIVQGQLLHGDLIQS